MTNTTWPPPWTLKPTDGDPHDSSDDEIAEGIGWDLSFGFNLNVNHADYEDVTTPLTIGAHFSDADKERGFVKREVTPAQLEEFARLLLNVAAAHKRRGGGTMKANRLPGHTLPNEGRLSGWPPSAQNGTGKARCSCGTESPELPSTTQRRAWFRDHKDDIRTGGDGIVWTGVNQ